MSNAKSIVEEIEREKKAEAMNVTSPQKRSPSTNGPRKETVVSQIASDKETKFVITTY